jgi:hypothetical protein
MFSFAQSSIVLMTNTRPSSKADGFFTHNCVWPVWIINVKVKKENNKRKY